MSSRPKQEKTRTHQNSSSIVSCQDSGLQAARKITGRIPKDFATSRNATKYSCSYPLHTNCISSLTHTQYTSGGKVRTEEPAVWGTPIFVPLVYGVDIKFEILRQANM